MAKQTWIYYVNTVTGGVAKVSTVEFDGAMVQMGFRRCGYVEYLRVKKTLKEAEIEVRMEGQMSNAHKEISIAEELARR